MCGARIFEKERASDWVYYSHLYGRERHNEVEAILYYTDQKQACESLEKEGERKCGRSSLNRNKRRKEWVHVSIPRQGLCVTDDFNLYRLKFLKERDDNMQGRFCNLLNIKRE